MKFFVPAARDEAEAESVYQSIVKFHDASSEGPRVCALQWKHNGQIMTCAVGAPLPDYFGTGRDPVVAIVDCGRLYKVCTANRGVLRGEGVLAGKSEDTVPTFFES